MRINYKSDFKLLVGFKLNQEDIAVPEHDFSLTFRSERGGDTYVCSHTGDEWVNCRKNGEKLLCLFDNHGLWHGSLTVEYRDDAPDADMADGVLTTVTPSALDVELVSGAGDGSAVAAEVVVDITTAIAEAKAAAERADAIAADLEAKRDSDYWRGATGPQGPQGERGPMPDMSGYYTSEETDTLLAQKAGKNGSSNERFNVASLKIGSYATIDGTAPTIKVTNMSGDKVNFPYGKNGTLALLSDIPTAVSQLSNDAGYLVPSDIAGKADAVQMVTDTTARSDETLMLAANTFYKFSGGFSGAVTLSLTAAATGWSVWAGKFLCNDASLSLSVSPAVEVVDAPTFKSRTWYEWNIVDGVMLLKAVGEEVSNG